MTDSIAFRAGAMCIAREPHRSPGEDWPCAACRRRVASAVASSAPRTRSAHLPPLGAGHGISDDTKGGTA